MLPGLIRPGLREPIGYTPSEGHSSGYNPVSSFRPTDLDLCYPTPNWVAKRIRDYPQVPVGNALRDPLPIAFTAEETRRALFDVRQASHQNNNRWCARVPAASVHIAMQVLPILMSRNGGWIDFSGRRQNPMLNTPGSNLGQGSNLQCMLYGLPGKPLPSTYNACNRTPAHPSRTYSMLDVSTTFAGAATTHSTLAGHRGPMPPEHSGFLGNEIEEEDVEVVVPGLPLFELVTAFGVHDELPEQLNHAI